MTVIRLLLPFTQGEDVSAIDAALMLAQQLDATLVAFSLIRSSGTQAMRGAQPEYRQPSGDFLEVVQQQSVQVGVPVARIELTTHNAGQSIQVFAQELECAGIVLFLREGTGILLDTSEVRQILEEASVMLYLMRLPAQESASSPPKWRSRWFQRRRGYQVELIQIHTCPTAGVSRQLNAEIDNPGRSAPFIHTNHTGYAETVSSISIRSVKSKRNMPYSGAQQD